MPALTATFGQLLRYFLAGAFFLLLVRLSRPSADDGLFVYTDKGVNALLFPVLALVVGSLAYCVHRAVVYPFFHKFVFWLLGRAPWRRDPEWLERISKRLQCLRWLPWVDWQSEQDATIDRLSLIHPSPHDHIAGWGAEVHFLYVSTELLMFAILIWPRGWGYFGTALGVTVALIALLFTLLWDRNLVAVEVGFHQTKKT